MPPAKKRRVKKSSVDRAKNCTLTLTTNKEGLTLVRLHAMNDNYHLHIFSWSICPKLVNPSEEQQHKGKELEIRQNLPELQSWMLHWKMISQMSCVKLLWRLKMTVKTKWRAYFMKLMRIRKQQETLFAARGSVTRQAIRPNFLKTNWKIVSYTIHLSVWFFFLLESGSVGNRWILIIIRIGTRFNIIYILFFCGL